MRRIAVITACVAIAAIACNSIVGLSDLTNVDCVGPCGADATSEASPDGSTEASADAEEEAPPPGTCTSSPDPRTAAPACSPKELGEMPCGLDAGSCPANNCIAPANPDLKVIDFRISHLAIWYPKVLADVSDTLVHPMINPSCVGGSAVLNVLLQLDTTTKQLRVGSARPSKDGKTYAFSDELLDPSLYQDACNAASFLPTAPIKLQPFSVSYTLSGQRIASGTIARTYIASWDTPSKVPSTVPLIDASIQNAVISADRQCIGKFDPAYACAANHSQGWTTAGLITGKIPLDEADQIPLPVAGCQTLCAVLANDAAKVDGDHCKRGPDGKVIPFGDTCVSGADCHDAVWFSAAFAAQSIVITP
jgi:hypothetical protein